MPRLAGKIAIITGASKGIGKGIAEVFAAEGANLVLVDRDSTALETVVGQLSANLPGTAVAFKADITKAADMEALAEKTMALYGRIDILCLNAGIYPTVLLDDMNEADWDLVLDTNLKSIFLAVKACLPTMKKQHYGRIVITSSITGPKVAQPGLVHYGASKAGVNGFIKSAALELAKCGITVNGVEPGNIATEGIVDRDPTVVRDLERAIPLGHLGTTHDVAYAMLFLASDEAKYITGETIVVDGGQILPESSFVL
jgi:3-oxoacyl-[acyl-carrier protein] reductase